MRKRVQFLYRLFKFRFSECYDGELYEKLYHITENKYMNEVSTLVSDI